MIPSIINYNNANVDNGQDIVNVFGKLFSSIYKQPLSNIPVDLKTIESPICINYIDITLTEVFNELDIIKLNTATGPDNLSAKFLIECRFILGPIILSLLKNSLRLGNFLTTWKTIYISPIFKKR